jgi:arylsulfatase A-like enzyme
MNRRESHPRGGALGVIGSALLGFLLADLVILLLRAPGLLLPAHLGGLAALLASGILLYLVYGLFFLGFFVLLYLVGRLLRSRWSSGAVGLAAIVLGIVFLELQIVLQKSMLGMYISLGSPRFYVPTLIVLGGTLLVYAALVLLSRRLSEPPPALARLGSWPGLTGVAAVALLLLTVLGGHDINVLGVYDQAQEREPEKECPAPAGVQPAAGSPNFIVVQIEALRRDLFDAQNTPFLWNLAQENIQFTRYYTVASATRPSVTSLFTSLYPAQHGCYNLALGAMAGADGHATVKVSEAIVTLPRLLQARGYRTLQVTSNGLASDPVFGFEEVYRRFDATDPYRFRLPSFHPFVGFFQLEKYLQLWRIFKVVFFAPDHSSTYFEAARLNETVRRELGKGDDRPFFLYLHYMEPHSPYYFHPYRPVQVNLYTRSQRENILAAYRSELRAADAAVADLFAYLEEAGLRDDTWVFITADHGEEFLDHHGWGHGKSLYPEVIAVPAVLVPPRDRPARREVTEVVESIDIMPTLAGLAGVPIPRDWEGRPLAEFVPGIPDTLADPEAPRDVAYAQFHDGVVFWASLISGEWQVLLREAHGTRKFMLFNLLDDPLAQRDLAGTGVAREEELVTRLETTLARLEATAERFRGEAVVVDEEHLKQLRALGYVD